MKTKSVLVISMMVLSFILMISAVSANTGYNTVINGIIYDSPDFTYAHGVAGATVYVTCNSIEKNTTSLSDGFYSIKYTPEEGCFNTTASAYAEKNGVYSVTQTTDVHDDYIQTFDLYLGVINLVLIPEFGVFVGTLTLLGAVGVFFLIRRK